MECIFHVCCSKRHEACSHNVVVTRALPRASRHAAMELESWLELFEDFCVRVGASCVNSICYNLILGEGVVFSLNGSWLSLGMKDGHGKPHSGFPYSAYCCHSDFLVAILIMTGFLADV